MLRPLCLPDDDDLTLDLPEEGRGMAVGWGLDTAFYRDTTCNYVKGVSDPNSLSTTLKKIELK